MSFLPKAMESKLCRNLYFAGEVIDVDAYTGGIQPPNRLFHRICRRQRAIMYTGDKNYDKCRY